VSRFARSSLALSLALGAGACSEYVSTAGPEHCGTVSDEVWGRDYNPHDITCDVTVIGDLVIGPGVRLRFAPGTSLTVLGSLRVDGTAERPVRFEPAEADRAWGGVIVGRWDDAPHPSTASSVVPARVPRGDVSIRNAIFVDGGLTSDARGALTVLRGGVHVEDVSIVDPRQCGVQLGEDGRLTTTSTGIEVTGALLSAVCAHPAAVGSLPTDLALDDGAFVEVSSGTVRDRHVWRDLGVPLSVQGDVRVFRGELTVEPGVVARFGAQAHLTVGGDEPAPVFGEPLATGGGGQPRREQASRLVLAGTAGSPIVLGAAREGSATSAWGGLRFLGATGEATGELAHVEIRGAGAGVTSEPASVAVLEGGVVLATDVTIAEGYGAGLLLDGGTLHPDSRGLTITENAYPAVVTPEGLLSLPSAESVYTGNTVLEAPSAGARGPGDVVYVLAGRLSSSGTIRRLGVPVRFDASLILDNPAADAPLALTVEPGVELLFPSNGGFEAGTDGLVDLVLGSELGPDVTLRGVDDATSPWRGLRLGEGAPGATLRRVAVRGAGGSGWGVRIDAADVDAHGLTISGHTGPGLLLEGTFAPGSRDLVIRDGQGAIHAEVASVPSIPEQGADLSENDEPWVLAMGTSLKVSGTWGALDVPYRIDDPLVVNGEVDDAGTLRGARLTFQAGVNVIFGRLGWIRTERFGTSDGQIAHGTLAAVGTSAAPIVLRAADPAVGFPGLLFRDEDLIDEELLTTFPLVERSALRHVVVDGGGSGAALAAVTFEASTLAVEAVTVRNAPNFGVALASYAFTDPTTPLPRCDLFARSAFAFSGNAGSSRYEGQLGPDDLDVVDFRPEVVACD
jgi:hypothetical protein